MPEENQKVRFRSPQPAQEFQEMLSKIMNSTESVKEVERIIQTPNSKTEYSYEIQVDSATGKQKVIERFTTTKKECAICGAYFSHLNKCSECGIEMCANDSDRLYTITVCKICGSGPEYRESTGRVRKDQATT